MRRPKAPEKTPLPKVKGRQYMIEERHWAAFGDNPRRTYWIAIDKARTVVLNAQGYWVNILSVDSDRARFDTRAEVETAIGTAKADEERLRKPCGQEAHN